MTPTARTLARLKADGWTAQVVEKWIAPVRRRVDLYGLIDILAIHPDRGILGVQACSDGGTRGSDVAAHVTKALAEPRLPVWLLAGGAFEVWGWGKRGARGKRKVWTLRRNVLRLDAGAIVVVEAAA